MFINRNSSFYFFGWQIDSSDAGEIFQNILRSIDKEKDFGNSNFGYYSNQQIDNISKQLYYEMDQEKRLELMYEGFEIAMNDVAIIPLYEIKHYILAKENINIKPRANTIIRIEDIHIV